MSSHRVARAWARFVITIKDKFGTLSDDDLTMIAGKRDQLIGKFRDVYGITHEEAEGRVRQWEMEQDVKRKRKF